MLGLALAIAATLAFLPAPFIWLAAALAMACFVTARRGRGFARVLYANLALLALGVGAIETAFAVLMTRRDAREARFPPGYFQLDDDFGGAPVKSSHARVRKWHDSTLVYDVTYTFGANGLRQAPPDRGANPAACVLFFTDSFVLGEGLRDDQTLPYRVGVLTDGRARTFNFGFHGFGAQQMLVAFERGRVAAAVDCRVTHVVYLAIADHVARASGLPWFTRHSPRYDVLPDGHGGDSVAHHGHFDDAVGPDSWSGRIDGQLLKSFVYRWLDRLQPPADAADLTRYVAIVAASERLARARYPGCRFDVLWWPMRGANPIDDAVLPALRRAGLEVHDVAQVLPGFSARPQEYWLSPYDAHPSARADDLMARFVAGTILGVPQPATPP